MRRRSDVEARKDRKK